MAENVIVLESSDLNQGSDDDMQIENPQEALYYIPLTHGRSQLSLKTRISLLRQEMLELDAKTESELQPQDYQISQSHISEISSITNSAESLIRGQGVHIDGYLGIEGNISSLLGKSMLKILDNTENATYQLNSPVPQSSSESKDRQTAGIANISARLSKLEDTVGLWRASSGYYSVMQAFSLIKKRISMLNPKKLEALSSQAEELNAELDMVKNQLELMQTAGVEQKIIDEMYPLVEICDQVMPIIPEIVERLETIKRVHDEGSRFNERVQEIRERQLRIQEKLSEFQNNDLKEEWNSFKIQIGEAFCKLEKKIGDN